jgi:hypothetical protein
MVEQLFGSKTRVKLLQLFYSNPNRSFYVREITRKIDEQINSVRRELSNLLSIGIISSDTTNNRLYYEVNQKYEYYKPLAAIFGAGTTAAPEEGKAAPAAVVSDELQGIKALGNVELALFTGQFTRDARVNVDFVVVGDVNQTQLNKFVEELEAKEGKEIRYVCMSSDEFKYRQQVNDRFLATVTAAKKQILVDREGVFSVSEE